MTPAPGPGRRSSKPKENKISKRVIGMETVTMRDVLSPKTKDRSDGSNLVIKIPLCLIRSGIFVQNISIGRGMRALVRSIEKNGVRSPICVSAEENGMYELITGKRRVVAARKAGLKEIPAVVYNPESGDPGLVRMLSEGLAGMHFLDEAESYRSILESMEVSQGELARTLGKSQGYISNKIRLLTLTPAVRRLIKDNDVSERHAREVMKIIDEKLQKAVVTSIIENKMTVKETEEEVEAILRDSGDLRRKLAQKISDYEDWNRTMKKSSREILAADKMRQLIRAAKSIADIARKSGLRVLTGQINTDKFLEIKIQVQKGEDTRSAVNAQKAA